MSSQNTNVKNHRVTTPNSERFFSTQLNHSHIKNFSEAFLTDSIHSGCLLFEWGAERPRVLAFPGRFAPFFATRGVPN